MPTILRFDKPALFSIENFGGLQKIADIDEKNCIVKTVLMQLSAISRNRTFYSGEDFVRCLTTSVYVNEQLSQGVWFGELEHPEKNCTQDRFFKIDDTRISHKILDYKVNGDIIDGHVQFVAPLGYIPWDWIQKNSNIAFSVRVFTPNFLEKKDEKGVAYIAKVGDMIPITFDCVRMPGFAIARIADPTKFASVNTEAAMPSTESLQYEKDWQKKQISFPQIDWRAKLSQEEFKHILSKESSLKILEDVYKFDASKSKITYNDDETVTISLNSSESLNLGVNTYELLKIHKAKYTSAGRSYIANSDDDPWSREDYEEYDMDYDEKEEELLESQSTEAMRKVTYVEYENHIKPSLKKELDVIYSEFPKILRQIFDLNVKGIPQKYLNNCDKNEIEKAWKEFKSYYTLCDKNKILHDIDNFVYRKSKFALSVWKNGRYIPLVNITFNNNAMKKLETYEDNRKTFWGYATVISLLLVWFPFPICLAMWIHMKNWRGYELAKQLTTQINARISNSYGKVKQKAYQSSSYHRVHNIFLKLDFKMSKKEAKNSSNGTTYGGKK